MFHRPIYRVLGFALLLPFVAQGSMVQAKAKPACHKKVIDSFTDLSHYNVNQNATVAVKKVGGHSSLALPGHKGTRVLQASASTADQPFAVGARFAGPQNWSKQNAVSFWYHGSKSDKPVTVQLLGAQAQDPGPAGWKMTWNDEFDGPAGTPPDPSKWTHDTGNNGGWGNHELEYYTASTDNASLDGNGDLVITARKAPSGNTLGCSYGTCLYTSARLLTQDRATFQYGRIEARIKLPAQEAGMWPAFWTLGANFPTVGWPQSGEIDIMENVGRLPGEIFGTSHGPVSGGAGNGGTYTLPSDQYDAFHTYSIDWLPNKIVWYVDGVKYHEVDKSAAGNDWVFNHPFFLLLNLAVGGDFAGPVGNDTTFPQSMTVDYVRVYQAPDTAERFEATFTDNFKGWKRITVPYHAFTRSADQPQNAPTSPLNGKEIWGWSLQAPAGFGTSITIAGLSHEKVTSRCKP